jgi:hypothetical protein
MPRAGLAYHGLAPRLHLAPHRCESTWRGCASPPPPSQADALTRHTHPARCHAACTAHQHAWQPQRRQQWHSAWRRQQQQQRQCRPRCRPLARLCLAARPRRTEQRHARLGLIVVAAPRRLGAQSLLARPLARALVGLAPRLSYRRRAAPGHVALAGTAAAGTAQHRRCRSEPAWRYKWQQQCSGKPAARRRQHGIAAPSGCGGPGQARARRSSIAASLSRSSLQSSNSGFSACIVSQ